MTWTWNTNRFSKADPEKVGPVLEGLEAKNSLTPQEVVRLARRKNSPLHDLFEWEDDKAAALYREDQARRIIRSIRYIEDDAGDAEASRMYVHVQRDEASGGSGYVRIDRVASDEQLRAQVIAEARAGLAAWAKRYRELEAAMPEVFEAISNALSQAEANAAE